MRRSLSDRIAGGMFGFAVGDALGGPVAFVSASEIQYRYGRLAEMIGGGVHRLKPGEPAGNTGLMLGVARGILHAPLYPLPEIGEEIMRWADRDPKSIPKSVMMTLAFHQGDWSQAAEKAGQFSTTGIPDSGSLVRTLPLALVYPDRERLDDLSARQSKMTLDDENSVQACIIYNRIASRLLTDDDTVKVLREETVNYHQYVDFRLLPNALPDGSVVATLRWALHLLATSHSFEEVVVRAVNLGLATDTTAAVCGGLAGIQYGFMSIPKRYLEVLYPQNAIKNVVRRLYVLRQAFGDDISPTPVLAA